VGQLQMVVHFYHTIQEVSKRFYVTRRILGEAEGEHRIYKMAVGRVTCQMQVGVHTLCTVIYFVMTTTVDNGGRTENPSFLEIL
jgi:hypothetical protein